MKLQKNKTIWFSLLIFFVACGNFFIFDLNSQDLEERDRKTLSEIKNILANSDNPHSQLNALLKAIKTSEYFWFFIGFLGEALFGSRMIVQWMASEKAKKNVIPVAFWYLSLMGSFLVLLYALHLRDPVFILSKGVGFLIYSRNIVLLRKDAGTPTP